MRPNTELGAHESCPQTSCNESARDKAASWRDRNFQKRPIVASTSLPRPRRRETEDICTALVAPSAWCYLRGPGLGLPSGRARKPEARTGGASTDRKRGNLVGDPRAMRRRGKVKKKRGRGIGRAQPIFPGVAAEVGGCSPARRAIPSGAFGLKPRPEPSR